MMVIEAGSPRRAFRLALSMAAVIGMLAGLALGAGGALAASAKSGAADAESGTKLVLPSVVGRRVFLDPLTVFFAVAFWGWLWGVPGAIIAVPVTIIIATSVRFGLLARNDGDDRPC